MSLVSEEVLLSRIKRAELSTQSQVEALRLQLTASDKRIRSEISGVKSQIKAPDGRIQTSALVGRISSTQLEDDFALAEDLTLIESSLSDLQTTYGARIQTLETTYSSKIYTEARKKETLSAANESATALVETETFARVEGDASIAGVVRSITATAPARWSNFILQSSDLTVSPWAPIALGSGSTTPVVTAGFEGPDGGSAWRLEAFSGGSTALFFSILDQIVSGMEDPRSQTTSLWLKSNTGLDQDVFIQRAASFYSVVTVTPTWQRFEFTDAVATPTSEFIVGSYPFRGSDAQIDILVAGTQMTDTGEHGPFVPTDATAVTSIAASISEESTARATSDGFLEGKYTLRVVAGNVVTGMNLTSASGPGTNQSAIGFQADVFTINTSSSGNLQVFTADATAVKLGDVLTVDLIDTSLYIGAGNYANSDTGFFVDAAGRLSLKDKLTWDGTTLSINGDGTFSGTLSAAGGTLGELTINSGGSVKQGQTAYDTGTGFWLGDDGGTTKFSMGSVLNSLKWTGSELRFFGLSIKEAGSPAAAISSNLVTGDSFYRFIEQAGGKHEWGGGSGAVDTNLYRDSANVLKTDDSFEALSIFVDNAAGETVDISSQTGYATIEMVGDTGSFIDLRPSATADFKLRVVADTTEVAVRTQTGFDLFLDAQSAYVQFGNHSTLGAETVTGFITVKDSTGTLRKLAVLS